MSMFIIRYSCYRKLLSIVYKYKNMADNLFLAYYNLTSLVSSTIEYIGIKLFKYSKSMLYFKIGYAIEGISQMVHFENGLCLVECFTHILPRRKVDCLVHR